MPSIFQFVRNQTKWRIEKQIASIISRWWWKRKNREGETKNKDFKWIKRLNRKIAVYLNPKSIDLTEDEKKKKVGTIIITLIILVLIISAYYFLIYAPSQEALESAKIDELNELHSVYLSISR